MLRPLDVVFISMLRSLFVSPLPIENGIMGISTWPKLMQQAEVGRPLKVQIYKEEFIALEFASSSNEGYLARVPYLLAIENSCKRGN